MYIVSDHVRCVPSTEYSLFIGDLTEEVDDLMLYTAFESKYKSVKMAKGLCMLESGKK